MANTNCEKCIFSAPATESDPPLCEFDIPNKINKTISISNQYYTIENYKCLYGFGKEQFMANKELHNVDLKSMVIEKANLRHYMIIDLRSLSDELLVKAIIDINNIVIKPKCLSIIIDPESSDRLYSIIKNNLQCNKWKVHVMLESMSFNDCINLILDTNLQESNTWCVLFIEYEKFLQMQLSISISELVDKLQDIFIIRQDNFHGVKYEDSSLNLMCLNARLYKSLVSFIDSNILYSISQAKEVVLTKYDI
jgi:hypothetical protein